MTLTRHQEERLHDAKLVRLEEGTDAGEFIVQQLFHIRDEDTSRLAFAAICQPEPTPEDFAKAVGSVRAGDLNNPYQVILGGLDEYAMEFESQAHRGLMDRVTASLAQRGIQSAEAFISAALTIARSLGEGS